MGGGGYNRCGENGRDTWSYSLLPTESPAVPTATPVLTATSTSIPATNTPLPTNTGTAAPSATASASPTPTPTVGTTPCVGDCDGSGAVTVDEIITGVNIALGTVSVDLCMAFDSDGNGRVTVDEILTGVNNALDGCG